MTRAMKAPEPQTRQTPGDVIYAFLTGHGLTPAQAYGIMGNFKIESNFSPRADNEGEGAIGIAQWEGPRRTALEQFAASHGGSEEDLNTQLEFFWHEFTTGGYAKAVEGMNDPGQVAAYIDQNYERSSGSARQQRIDAANSMAANGPSGGAFTTSDSAIALDSVDTATPDYKAALGDLYSVLQTVPELKKILDRAIKTGMPVGDFTDAIEGTDWWKTHSTSARQVIITRLNDPATYRQQLGQERDSIVETARQLGTPLSNDKALALARQALLQDRAGDSAWVQRQIVARHGALGTTDDFSGQAATTLAQVQQLAAQYGQNPSQASLQHTVHSILIGNTTMDDVTKIFSDNAKSKYPGLSDQIDAGMTVSQLADPYISDMAQILEVSPDSLNLNTPLIKQALQGVQDPSNGKTTAQQVPLWKFEQMVRSDPRWQYTTNARNTYVSALSQIGRDFGFSS